MNRPDRPGPERRDAYPHLLPITTRWGDNDQYGHVNNVVYYAWFDTVVNTWLIGRGALDVSGGEAIGLVVETACRYFSPVSFPEPVHAGLRVASVGTSSVRYEIGIFAGDAPLASAQGHFVHVYVDPVSRRPTALPARLREALASLRVDGARPAD